MKINITTLESEVLQIRTEATMAYNNHRDAVDRLYNAERNLAKARKIGDE